MRERAKLLIIAAGFMAAYYIPWDHEMIRRSGLEAFMMLQEYARQHVLTCLIPAFFIAGAIAVFVSQASVLKYFGAQANRFLSYMGRGPALALLLAGPALSLPSMLTLAGIMGLKKTLTYCTIVVILSTMAGMIYGWLVA